MLVVWPSKNRQKKKKTKSRLVSASSAEEETSVRALRSFLAQGRNDRLNAGGGGDDGDSSSSDGSPGGSTSWARRRNRQKRSASDPATSPSSSTSKASSSEGALRLALGSLSEVGCVESKTHLGSDSVGSDVARYDENLLSDDELNMRIADLEAMMEGEAGMRHLDSPPPLHAQILQILWKGL